MATGDSGLSAIVTSAMATVSPISFPFECRLKPPCCSHSTTMEPKNLDSPERAFSLGEERARNSWSQARMEPSGLPE